MLALIIKLSAIVFCAYISVDSFYKAKKIVKEVEADLLNPKTGKVFRARAIRNGVVFAIGTVLAIISLFLRIAPLGE